MSTRVVASTQSFKYQYKYQYLSLKYQYKYQYLSLKYQYQCQYPCLKYKYKYQYFSSKYQYQYKYLKMVLKYRSSTSINTQYYNLFVNCNRRTEKIHTNFRIRAFFIRTAVKQQVCVQLRTYADNVALPAVARRTAVRRAAIDRYLPPAGPTAAMYVAVNRPTDGQTETDGETDGRASDA